MKPPTALIGRSPELVIPMNLVYESEIRNDLAAMRLDPTVISL